MSVMDFDIRHRLTWLVSARLVVGTVLLGSAVLLQLQAPNTFPAEPFFLLIALTFALTVLYALTLSYARRHPWLVALQLATDAATVSAFVFLTGGISSYFALLYALPIIGASMLLSRRGGLWLALLSSVLYGGQVLLQYLASDGYLSAVWIGPTALLPSRRFAQYTVATDAFAFFAVAFLSGSLAEGLRRADRSLEAASSAIADLKALNQHVIDSLTSGLATTDRAGRLLTFNRAAEGITGHGAASVIGRPAGEVFQLPAGFGPLLERDLDGARTYRYDVTYRTSGGAVKELGFGISPLLTPDGRAGFLVSFQDVTAVRRLELEGRRQQRLAAVGEMAAGIAHEIRNPLASMVGSVQILRAELTLNREHAQLMDIVLRESERLNETIRSFLAYARPQPRTVTQVNVGRMLRDTAVLLRNSTDLREDHQIETDIPTEDLWHEADENQLRQIVWNLATNGLRAMAQGGRLKLDARLEASPTGRRLVLEIHDQGVGIPAEDLDGIFQPFHGGFAKGSGLGLAIVQRIVSDHEGEIQVKSEVGKGTSVKVTLPAAAAPAVIAS
jgi:two-component system sensor histidine kinase PilS (NtrC family)